MKKIQNPWLHKEGYNCFGCAPGNEAGLKMEFYEDGDEVVSIWHPGPQYQGWIDTLHGGIQAVLLALNGTVVPGNEGIVDDDIEACIANLGRLGSSGMREADKVILDIMLKKK